MQTRGRTFLLAGSRAQNAGAFPSYFLPLGGNRRVANVQNVRTTPVYPRQSGSILHELTLDRPIVLARLRAGRSEMKDLRYKTPEQEKHHA